MMKFVLSESAVQVVLPEDVRFSESILQKPSLESMYPCVLMMEDSINSSNVFMDFLWNVFALLCTEKK